MTKKEAFDIFSRSGLKEEADALYKKNYKYEGYTDISKMYYCISIVLRKAGYIEAANFFSDNVPNITSED